MSLGSRLKMLQALGDSPVAVKLRDKCMNNAEIRRAASNAIFHEVHSSLEFKTTVILRPDDDKAPLQEDFVVGMCRASGTLALELGLDGIHCWVRFSRASMELCNRDLLDKGLEF